jgi:hypothetical protein
VTSQGSAHARFERFIRAAPDATVIEPLPLPFESS